MRRFSANYVFTGVGEPIRNGIVSVNNEGIIVEVIDPQGHGVELASMEFHNGVIVPGFVNTHCHTELSHLRNRTQRSKGLAGFVDQIRSVRLLDEEVDEAAISNSIHEMHRLGTVAVADICNTTNSFSSKMDSPIQFVNFIEALGMDATKAQFALERVKFIKELSNQTLNSKAFVTPHSVYSLSEKLWELLSAELNENECISIHFAESKDEELFTSQRKGGIAQNYAKWGLSGTDAPLGDPVAILSRYIPKNRRIILVHNTYLNEGEAKTVCDHFNEVYFSLCPTSNLFIENTIPDIPMLMGVNPRITIGTDSYASSATLSVLEQIKTIQKHYPSIPFSRLLEWATINGAKALGLEQHLGTIEVGKSPGLVLISPFDFKGMNPKPNSSVRRLV